MSANSKRHTKLMENTKKKWFWNCWERKHSWVNTVKKIHGKRQHRSEATEGSTMNTYTHHLALDTHQLEANDNFRLLFLAAKIKSCDANPSVIISRESSRERSTNTIHDWTNWLFNDRYLSGTYCAARTSLCSMLVTFGRGEQQEGKVSMLLHLHHAELQLIVMENQLFQTQFSFDWLDIPSESVCCDFSPNHLLIL